MSRQPNASAMTKVAAFIVDHRLLIGLIFAALMVFSVFSMNWVQLEDNIIQFLPADAESKLCLDVMSDEFVSYGYGQIILENVTIEEADRVCEQLRTIDHVDEVLFNHDTEYLDQSALLSISFDTVDTEQASYDAMDEVRQVLKGYESYIYSSIGYDIAKIVTEQMEVVAIIVAIVVLIVLLLTSQTFGEVLVLIATFLTAALVNTGTNFLLGKISVISDSVSLVLQLALSVDYAVILCNRYKEEREKADRREALVTALGASIPAILASSLTTIAGLFAMTLMQFRLGYDLGVVLIKAIAVSLITVFLFMPMLLMLFDKLMMRTKHRSFVPKVPFIGKFAHATRVIIPIVFVFLFAGGAFMSTRCNYAYDLMYTPPFNEIENDYALRMVETKFKENMFAVLVPAGDYESEKALVQTLKERDEVNDIVGLATTEVDEGVMLADPVDYRKAAELAEVDPEIAQALFAYYAAQHGDHRAAEADLENYKIPLIDLFVFLHDECLDADLGFELEPEQTDMINDLYGQLSFARNQLQGPNYSRLLIYTNLPMQEQVTYDFLDYIHETAAEYYPENVLIFGDSMIDYDFQRSFSKDNTVVSLLSILFVLVILFFTFRAFALPPLLILVIQGSIWINFAIATLTGHYIYFVCYLIVSAVQMGANIDYGIVITTRYQEFRRTCDRKEAVTQALNLAFPTLITSGLMLTVAGLLIGLRISEGVTAWIGYYIGTGTLITLFLAMFVLPQILVLSDGVVSRTALPAIAERGKNAVRRVLRGAVAVALAAACVAALVTLPTGLLRLDASARDTLDECEAQLDEVASLQQLDAEQSGKRADAEQTMFDFAESYVTDRVGQVELAEGERLYAEGQAELEAGLKLYDEYYQLYQDGLAQYEEGKATLLAGQQEYDSYLELFRQGQKEYEDGLALYNSYKAQYDAGLIAYAEGVKTYEEYLKLYEEGKAAYDEGLEQYNAGLAEYEEGKALLDQYGDIYNIIQPFYAGYQSLERRYQAAAEAGDHFTALRLYGIIGLGRLVFTTPLGEIGTIGALLDQVADGKIELAEAEILLAEAEQELADGLAELEAGEKELADGKKELEAAEKELADGRIELEAAEKELADGKKELEEAEKELEAGRLELEAGQAELEAGEKELADGKKQLDDAEKEIEDGKKQLADAEKEIEDGRRFLAENQEKLQNSMVLLDDYFARENTLIQRLDALTSAPEIRNQLTLDSDRSDKLHAAGSYYTDLRRQAERSVNLALWARILLIAAAVPGLAAAILLLIGKRRKLTVIFAVCAALLGLAGWILWQTAGTAGTPIALIFLLLCAAAAVCAAALTARSADDRQPVMR